LEKKPMLEPRSPRILVVGAGGIGGVTGALLTQAGHDVTMLSTNTAIADALGQRGFVVRGAQAVRVAAPRVVTSAAQARGPFDFVVLATQPPQVEAAAQETAPLLGLEGRLVCLQNGLCEPRVAPLVGAERVAGAVVAWGASVVEPGVYDRTSSGGFALGRLSGSPDGPLLALQRILGAVGPVALSDNLLGARFSKLAINCAISTLGTIGGDRLGVLLRRRLVRRLGLEIMTEVVQVAHREGVRLEAVSGTIDLDWVALTPEERRARGSPALAAKHAVLLGVGLRYRRLRSSMLSAIERGRTPAVDFLNGEVVDRAERHGFEVPVNRAARDLVWRIARGQARPGFDALRELHAATR
jgi:2-dehydropantoate 2-reductase